MMTAADTVEEVRCGVKGDWFCCKENAGDLTLTVLYNYISGIEISRRVYCIKQMHDSIEVSLLGPEALKELCHASNPKILEAVKTDNKETLKWLLQQCPDLDINLSDLLASDTTPEDKSTTPNEVEGELYLCYWQCN